VKVKEESNMHIEKLQCESCKKLGWLNEFPGYAIDPQKPELELYCDCGHTTHYTDPATIQDHRILSNSPTDRFSALSNAVEFGEIVVLLGDVHYESFSQPLDHLADVNVNIVKLEDWNAHRYPIVYDKATHGFKLFVGQLGRARNDEPKTDSWVNVRWEAQGLRGPTPPWYAHFYSATVYAYEQSHKFALLEYAATFEVFLEAFLRTELTNRYKDTQLVDHILDKTWNVTERLKKLLEFATGKKMYDKKDALYRVWHGIYDEWFDKVQTPRNDIAHGKPVNLGDNGINEANQAVYQALRWLQSLVGTRALLD
jgi:hypothetical protein